MINPRLLVAINHLGWMERGRDYSVQPDSRNDEEGGTEAAGAHALGVMGGKFCVDVVESRRARPRERKSSLWSEDCTP